MKNIRIYDNGGASFDRYTVVFMNEPEYQPGTFMALGMSEHPFHPQGFGQHCAAMPGRHLGKRIKFEDLPEDCQKLVKQDLEVSVIYECGICGSFHPWDFDGDCRDDANRFAGVEDYAAKTGIPENEIEVRCMCDRIEADGFEQEPCPVCGKTA